MAAAPRTFASVSLPHGFTTRELVTRDEKAIEHAKLLSGKVGRANQAFVGIYDAVGELASIVIASHREQRIFSVQSKGYKLPKD